MNCPSCNQQAIGFFRASTSFTRGVSYSQAIKGYFKCQHCGALLRLKGFKPALWIYFGLVFTALFIYWIFLSRIILIIGYKGSIGLILLWLVFVLFGITYVKWKNARIDKA